MRHLRSFEEFIEEGIIRKTTKDEQRAKNLILESERKTNSLNENITKVGVKNENANDYVEYCYDIIMFLIRAKLHAEGYSSSGQNAHEAEVSFSRNLGFDEKETQFINQLRYFRNGILYYGKRFDKEYAEKVIEFTRTAYQKMTVHSRNL